MDEERTETEEESTRGGRKIKKNIRRKERENKERPVKSTNRMKGEGRIGIKEETREKRMKGGIQVENKT